MLFTIYSLNFDDGMYVGATGNLKQRLYHHSWQLNRGVHDCIAMQQLWTAGEKMTVNIMNKFSASSADEVCAHELRQMKNVVAVHGRARLLNNFIVSDPKPFLGYFQPMRTPKRKKEKGTSPYIEGFAEAEELLEQRIRARDSRILSVNDPRPMGRTWDAKSNSYVEPSKDFPTWDKGGKKRSPQPLYLEDLIVGLWAVKCEGEKGINYGQLSRCFQDVRKVQCHNNKAAAIFKTLLALGLIEKIGNYSVGRHGNKYRLLADGEVARPKPTPMERTPNNETTTVDEDPW